MPEGNGQWMRCLVFGSQSSSAPLEPSPYHDLITPLTEPGQALQPAPIRTVLPRFARLPAPLRSAGFPSHTLGAVLPVPGLIGAQSKG